MNKSMIFWGILKNYVKKDKNWYFDVTTKSYYRTFFPTNCLKVTNQRLQSNSFMIIICESEKGIKALSYHL